MRRFVPFFVGVLMTFSFLATIPPPAQAANCQFVLGFATLHGLIPSIVGNCLANENHATNGDGLQPTTNGLLVWRKADNFTAFTNGSTTWVNGPFGLQMRPNNQRFAWEVNSANVARTQVIRFTPPTTASQQASGSCFASSAAALRADAFRCMAGNLIMDPCFTIPGNSSAVICVRDPQDPSTFVQFNLTQPLPAAGPTASPPQPWFLKLADQSSCGVLTGATGAVNGQRLNFGCTSGWDLLGTPTQDTVWTIPAVLLAPNSLNVQQSATAKIAIAWE